MKNAASSFRYYLLLLLVAVVCFVVGGLTQPAHPKQTASAFHQIQAAVDSVISKEEAERVVAKHRTGTGGGASNSEAHRENRKRNGRSYYLSRDILEKMLSQRDRQGLPCAGLRVYNGRNKGNEAKIVVVSVDTKKKDLVGSNPNQQVQSLLEEYRIVLPDDKCPSNCDGSLLLPESERNQ